MSSLQRRRPPVHAAHAWHLVAPFASITLFVVGLAERSLAGEMAPASNSSVLSTAAQVRALSEAEAFQRHPVKLRGVVTLVFLRGLLFVQDETGGVIVNANFDTSPLSPGDAIEVEGVSDYGFVVPRVAPTSWRKLGRAPLPAPVRISSDDLMAGRHVCEWVELEGVVRSAAIGTDRRCMLRVDMGARVVEVQLVDVHREEGRVEEGRTLVDARVRVRGVVASFVNERRQLIETYVRISGRENIEVVVPPPADVFALPVTSVAALRMFSSQGYSAHRVKLRGVVTGQQPGEAVYLREGGRGIVVFTDQAGELTPGDLIEVAGYPEMGATSPRLHDAVFRRVSSGTVPTPRAVTREDLLSGLLDGELVSLGARLVGVAQTPSALTLVIETGGATMPARLAPLPAGEVPWLPGSRLQVTAICRVERAQMPTANVIFTARDVELWLRSPDDVAVTEAPPWWTPRRLLIMVALAASVALAALGWVALLRRQVREQTAIIRDKIQKEAVAEERLRIAREFHDTLEQELAGLAVRLDALQFKVNDPGSAGFVSALQRLAHRLQDEARHFIWNLRERRWENTTLHDALADAVAERHAEDGVKIQFVTEGKPSKLSAVVSHHLLRIGQEAVMNAVQHAGAAQVRMDLRFADGEVSLTVVDDGRGFDVAQATERRAGHFGITGMRERARRLGGKLELQSEPGRGTTVVVRVPAAALDHPSA